MPAIEARPKPVDVDLARTALIVVDMQNAFASRGGMLDRRGSDLSNVDRVIDNNRRIIDAARATGVKVIYLQMGYRPDLLDVGREAPCWQKEYALATMDEEPELRGKLLVEGTWEFEIADGLKPRDGDVVVRKNRYSGFVGTPLDNMLRSYGVKYLLFTGIATNVCVESTIRSAYFLDYWPILIADATLQAGPSFLFEATVHNVASFFGWVAETEEVVKALQGLRMRLRSARIYSLGAPPQVRRRKNLTHTLRRSSE